MPNNNTTLFEMVQEQQNVWTSFRCGELLPNFNGFHFGWASEVNDIHKKELPLMIVNPPHSTASIQDMEHERVTTITTFTCQIYGFMPSENYGKDNINYADTWDGLENCFYLFLRIWLQNMGSRVVLGNGNLQITRTIDASADQLYMIECTYNVETFRYCFDLTYPSA